jgi:hypothetical protein
MEGKSNEITDTAAVVGGKRKNGHKMECCCHICENMTKKAKRGGYKVDAEKRMLKKMGGSKKKNGHRMDCGCPICKNMKNAKKGKKGGAKPGEGKKELNPVVDEEPVVDEVTPVVYEEPVVVDEEVTTDIINPDNFIQKRAADWVQAPEEEISEIDGGRKKKGNGHKATCGCPICKNMRKSKKGGAKKSARKNKSRGRSSGRSRRRAQRRTQRRN